MDDTVITPEVAVRIVLDSLERRLRRLVEATGGAGRGSVVEEADREVT